MLLNNYKNFAYFLIVIILFIKYWNYFLSYKLPSIDHFNNQNWNINKNQLIPLTRRLRVLTLNMFLRPPMISHKHNDFKDERTDIFANMFPYFDVILLQEVHTCFNFRCNKLITEAAKHGLYYHYFNYGPSVLSRFISNNGLLILSRFPISSCDSIAFNNCASYDTIIEKGCNYIKIRASPELDVHIFNSHLQSSYGKIDPICENVRKCQLEQLKYFIKSKCNIEKDAIICGGDFNINSKTLSDYSLLNKTLSEYNLLNKTLSEYSLLNKTLSPLVDSLKGRDEMTIQVPYDKDGREDNQFCTVCKNCLASISLGKDGGLVTPDGPISIEDQRLDYIYYNENHHRLKYKTSKVLPLKLNRDDVDFISISDHAGVYTEFTF